MQKSSSGMRQAFPFPLPPDGPPVIIAEIGINHSGDVELGCQMVKAAARAGAHVVKFQTHMPQHEMLRDGFSADYIGGSFYDLLAGCQLTYEDHRRLKELAESWGLTFMSTPFCREAADMLEQLGVAAYKVGSGESTNGPLLRHIARKGKPMVVSTGMSSLLEIMGTVDLLLEYDVELVVNNCTSVYPCPHGNVMLGRIAQYRELFERRGIRVGQSDHSQGIATALGAVALGAVLVEKHFTIDKTLPGPDQAASIGPVELERLVTESRQIWQALRCVAGPLDGETQVRAMARESVVTTVPIRRGDLLGADNLWVRRPGTGIPAGQLEHYYGRTALRDIPADVLLVDEWVTA